MARLIIVLCCIFYYCPGQAQSSRGITGERDTSFTTYSAYASAKKNYPQISIVPELHSASVKEKRNIVYCRRDKRALLLDVFYPAMNKGKRIAVMMIHGGGWRSGNRGQHYPLAQRLAAMGYVCITPEYRLSTEALYPAAVYDLKAALKWIRLNAGKFNIDTTKIAAAGFSSGGELAAFLGVTRDVPLFADSTYHVDAARANAVIDIDGILSFVHPESGEGDDSKKISASTYWFGYGRNENPALLTQASPLTHAGPGTPPFLFINSSVTRMHAGRDDFIKILDAHRIYSEVHTFENAPHTFCLFDPWFGPTVEYIDVFLKNVFKNTKAESSAPKTGQRRIVVSQDGKGDFRTVQAAFDAVPVHNTRPVTIFVRKGVYKEKLRLDSLKNFVRLTGEDKFNTIVTYDDHTGKVSPAGDTINTYTSWSFLEAADDFTAENITFQNDAGFSAGQAVALMILGDRVKLIDCRLIGNQDVLFPSRPFTRQYFKNCYIEGTTDFIFGPSTAWFERCHIHSKKNSHITAASTPRETSYGYVFNECILTADTGLNKVSLGRPWRPYASVAYLRCRMDGHILPEGWNNWKNAQNELTARYAEYKNYGPGAAINNRVKWAKQLNDAEAAAITVKNVFGNWRPD